MRLLLPFLLLTAATLTAAPPANDNFGSRISLAGSSVTTTGSNHDATTELGENLRDDLFGATVWWSWIAPSSGWVRVDTKDSDFNTVLQISTGATVGAQTIVAFNDLAPDNPAQNTSSITFLASAGTTYNLAVGGSVPLFEDPIVGIVHLAITTGSTITPAYYPATLSFTPSPVNVTSAAVPVTASFTIQTKSGSGTGYAGVGFGWEDSYGDGPFIGPPRDWNGSQPATVLPQSFTAPRYLAPGSKVVWFKIVPSGDGPTLIFSGPEGGSGYALPSAAAQHLTVINTGPVDEESPVLTAFTITPGNASVTTAPATLQISATFTDAPAGVSMAAVELDSSSAVNTLHAVLTLTAGTAQSGTWTGSIAVPRLYPSGNYAVLVTAADVARNDHSWGTSGSTEIPGGDLTIPIIGGSAYEEWAYTYWFAPGEPGANLEDDADSDGKTNLLSYAFDLNPHNIKNSLGSLPLVELTGTGTARKLRITYIRRKASTLSGLTYAPQFSSTTNGIWETVTGGTATSISSQFERVIVEDTATVSTERRRYGRVKVEYIAP